MMLHKMGIAELCRAVKMIVEKNTGLKCYDEMPENESRPLYFMEVVRGKLDNTKTMWMETYEVLMHAVAEPTKRSEPIYELIEKLETAMTESIPLSEDYDLISQRSAGVRTIKMDDSGERHAVISFEFKICYGFKAKI